MDEALWDRVQAALYPAQSHSDAVFHVNRLLGKWFKPCKPCTITKKNTSIHVAWLTPQQMGEFTRGHEKNYPRMIDGPPLVAIEYLGITYMLDGTTRLNYWLDRHETVKREVIILKRVWK